MMTRMVRISLYLYRSERHCDLWYVVKIYEKISIFHELHIIFTFLWLKGYINIYSMLFTDVRSRKKAQQR
ncbi:hypothetical protein C170_06284 [Paenibacillus sp. FSL H7-689]|nr:hypothetical protein C170_06284 [Paenibacillus sp. FSL H7-689]